MEQTTEFQSLCDLIASTCQSSVELGLGFARHYKPEFDAHFGCTLEEMQELYEFLILHGLWDFKTSFLEIRVLNLSHLPIIKIPESIWLLKNMVWMYLGKNYIQDFPTSLTKIKNLRVSDFVTEQAYNEKHLMRRAENNGAMRELCLTKNNTEMCLPLTTIKGWLKYFIKEMPL